MKPGKWLNSLDGIDQLVILVCFGVSLLLAHYVINYLGSIYAHLQRDNKFAPDFRPTPTIYFLVSLPILFLVYILIGSAVSGWLH